MLLRVFRSQPGRDQQLVGFLQAAATRMIQEREADAVQICQYCDMAERIIWIENRTAEVRRRFPTEDELQKSCPSAVERASPARAFDFLDGFYRYPLPPCRVWSLEVCPPADHRATALTQLLDRSREASNDSRVGGMSVYREVGAPAVILVFLALGQGASPMTVFGPKPLMACAGEPAVWRPLTVVWTLGRLSLASGLVRVSSGRYPRAAFWTRSAYPGGSRAAHDRQLAIPQLAGSERP